MANFQNLDAILSQQPTQQPQQQSGGFNLKSLLPTAGAVALPLIADIATGGLALPANIALSALGGGAGKALQNKLEGQNLGQGVLGQAALGGVGAGVGEGLGAAYKFGSGALAGLVGKGAVDAAGNATGDAAGNLLTRRLASSTPGLAEKIMGGADNLATRSVGATKTLQKEFENTFGTTLGKALQKEGAVGMAPDEFVTTKIQPLQQAYTKAVSDSGATTSVKDVLAQFDDKIAQMEKSNVPSVNNQAKQLQQIRDNLAKNYGKGDVSAGMLNADKIDFQLNATPSMKISSPADFTVNDTAAGILRNAVNKAVENSGQTVDGMSLKAAGQRLNQLHTIGDTLTNAQYAGGKGTLSFRNLLAGAVGGFKGMAADAALNQPGVQSRLIGALAGGGSKLAEGNTIPGSLFTKTLGQNAVQSVAGAANQTNNPQSLDQLNNLLASTSDTSGADQSQNGGLDNKTLAMLLISDIQRTGGKNAATIEAIGKLLAPASQQLSTAQQTRKDSIQTALSSLDAAQSNLVKSGGAKGLLGFTATLPGVGQYLDPSGAAYNSTRIELATQLAKAITGGSRPAQTVIEQYLESLPNVNDTPAYAQAKIDKVRSELLQQAKTFKFNDIIKQYNSSGSASSATPASGDNVTSLLQSLSGR